MHANSDNLERYYSRKFSEFAEQLQAQIADQDLLDDIHDAIQSMLSGNSDVESDIYRILQEQHKAGNLRDETVDLVQRMLDRMLSEDLATSPKVLETATPGDDPFRDTTVMKALTPDDLSVDDRLQVGSVLRDRFLLQKRIAGGSMGVVYKALDRRLAEADDVEPWVAIKVLTPQLSRNGHALRALQQEAAKGRCLMHPNIVRFIDLDREDDIYFIVMEWLDGKSLATILDDSSRKKIDKETALDIVWQIAKALDYAHRRGVVHADVKPGNIMVSTDGDVKLFDFGVARVRQQQTDRHAEFDPGVLGAVTAAYSSMQVLTGEEPTVSDDVFSLACLAYRLLAGHRVFGPRNAAEAAEEGMEPQRPQGLNDAEWHALRKALSYSRVSRYPTPKDFVDALTGSDAVAAVQAVAAMDEPEEPRRRTWPYLLTLAVLMAGAFALYQDGWWLDRWQAVFGPDSSVSGGPGTIAEQSPPALPSIEDEPITEELIEEGQVPIFDDETPVEEIVTDEPPAEEFTPQQEMIDFSELPPADLVLQLARPGRQRTEVELTLREDEEPAVIDLVREANLAETLVLRIQEVSFSGNRSPWESGQYQISGDNIVRFMPGQDRARFTISMASDSLREPDRQVSLLARDLENAESEFLLINLTLQDDDQRNFESGLGSNTVAFALSQVFVREWDPAVQIDVVRLNPNDEALSVDYTLRDVTAREGIDYFAPGARRVQFGPGQRSARIFISLVQDSIPETDEAFTLELPDSQSDTDNASIFRRITVIIRDDDSIPE